MRHSLPQSGEQPGAHGSRMAGAARTIRGRRRKVQAQRQRGHEVLPVEHNGGIKTWLRSPASAASNQTLISKDCK